MNRLTVIFLSGTATSALPLLALSRPLGAVAAILATAGAYLIVDKLHDRRRLPRRAAVQPAARPLTSAQLRRLFFRLPVTERLVPGDAPALTESFVRLVLADPRLRAGMRHALDLADARQLP
uniref:hypothetical protein n=1 Tax=Pseudonocardia sp. CA-138482 TaxID=3240023 RepID=UPI003F4921E9